MTTTGDRYRNLDDFSRILALFEQPEVGEKGVNEIAKLLEMLPSKVSRILKKMEADRWLKRSPRTGKYRIGARFLQIGLLYVLNHPLRRLILPHLEQIAHEMSSFLVTWNIFENDKVIVVDHLRVRHSPLIHLLGSDMPLHSSSGGKLFLAYLDEGERDRILRSLVFAKFTTRTISDIRTMTEELRRVREQGYATDEEETREGISSLSTPIIDDEGKIVAALAIFGNSSDFSAERTSEVQYLKEKAVFISRQIGYVGGRIAF